MYITNIHNNTVYFLNMCYGIEVNRKAAQVNLPEQVLNLKFP